jgi:hypothetical protein
LNQLNGKIGVPAKDLVDILYFDFNDTFPFLSPAIRQRAANLAGKTGLSSTLENLNITARKSSTSSILHLEISDKIGVTGSYDEHGRVPLIN